MCLSLGLIPDQLVVSAGGGFQSPTIRIDNCASCRGAALTLFTDLNRSKPPGVKELGVRS